MMILNKPEIIELTERANDAMWWRAFSYEDQINLVESLTACQVALEAWRDWILSSKDGFPDEDNLDKAVSLTRAAGVDWLGEGQP